MSGSDEEYYVTLDFQSASPDLEQPYSLIGLETAHPILRIGRQVFVGTWATMVGTEMMFDDRGEWVMNVARRLILEAVDVTRRGIPQPKSAREVVIRPIHSDAAPATQQTATEGLDEPGVPKRAVNIAGEQTSAVDPVPRDQAVDEDLQSDVSMHD